MSDNPKVYRAKLADFKPDPKNANRHTERGRWMVENSMSKRGYARPAFAANDGTVLGGNLSTMEVAGAIDLGDGEVLVIETDGRLPIIHKRTDIEPGSDEARLLALEDNRTAEISLDWSPDQLLADITAGLDLSELFSTAEIDAILADINSKGAGGTDSPPQTARKDELAQEWGTAVGQVWQLGPHRLAVGDCTEAAVVERVMQGERAQMVFTDPPYNLASDGALIAANAIRASYGRLKDSDWDKGFAIAPALRVLERVMATDVSVYICTSQFLAGDIWAWMASWADFYNYVVWCKDNPMPSLTKRHWTWGTELITYATRGRHIFNFPTNGHALSWWQINGQAHETEHPTEKPIEVAQRAIQYSSNTGAIVFDGFCGSGTTIIACHNLNRQCRAIEIDAGYAAVTLQRFYDAFNIRPQLVEQG